MMRFAKKISPASVENGGKTPTHGSQPVTGRVKFEDSLCVFGLFGCGSLSNSSAAEDTSLRNLPSKMMVGRLFLILPFQVTCSVSGGWGVHPFLF